MKHSLFTLGIVAASLSVATLSCTTQQQPTEVTWGTFNIRYDNPGDSLNNWQYRKDNVAQFIKSQDIDIVGMQEVLHNQLEDLKSRLPEYAEVGVQHIVPFTGIVDTGYKLIYFHSALLYPVI